MIEHEWVHLTGEQLSTDPALVRAIERFHTPAGRAGAAAAAWLKERALKETSHIATYVLVVGGDVAAFYSLGMGEVELRSQHRQGISASHPRQGAVLVLWLARAAEASVDAATILRHAVGIAQIGSRRVGAAVIAVDPFDAATEDYWRQHFGFRASLTKRTDADGQQRSRLWLPLLLRDLSGLPGAHAGPRRFRHVLLGVQAELAPALIEASLGKLVRVDHRRRLDRPLGVGGSREDISLIVGHLT